MALKHQTILLHGGLNLVTPPIGVPAGQVTAALNYEPDVSGYRRIGGYERYDGRTAPSAGGTRGDITTVPGTGPVRGVWVYDGAVYAFRDNASNQGRMYKSSAAGWVEQTFGHTIEFSSGTAAFVEGDTLSGGTSGATATIKRVVLRSGAWSGTAQGYLVLANMAGTFQAETITGSTAGSATAGGAATAVALAAGGTYVFANHNFYGATKRLRMYFANGTGTAFEWDGSCLAPIRTGNDSGVLDTVSYVFHRGADNILTRDGSTVIMRGEFDKPRHVAVFKNHLFLSFLGGTLIFSGTGEPLDYRTAAGAGEIPVGSEITGFLPSASTAFIIFGRNRIDYLTGTDSANFALAPITDGAGAAEWSTQMIGDQPMYLDDGGVRSLTTTAAFGDWQMGTATQLVEPLFRTKRLAGVAPAASLRVKDKSQYRLFFDDKSGVTVFLGRKYPESMPFLLPIQVNCACAGELSAAEGERLFVGADDGYVYEFNKGPSFDGAEVQSYVRLPWNSVGAPSQNKRFHKVSIETDAPENMTIGVAYHVDYAIPGNTSGSRTNVAVTAGSQSLIPVADYDTITWSQPVQGLLEHYLDGFGSNIAITLVSEHTEEEPHALSSATMHFSPRGMKK